MTYRTSLLGLAGRAEAQAIALFDAFRAGRVDEKTFVAVLAALVAAANSRAVALADLSLAASVSLSLGRPVPTQGLAPDPTDPERLTKAATTLVAVENLTPERVGRLARAEPLTAAARAFSDGMKRSEHVSGWRRGLSANACQLCQWWSREGRVWSDDHPMPTHKGCSCSPIPVTR